ncbi:MAG: hypothetical protein JNM58_06410 [Xanthomonadaceae bacterium]|nr:hypothetical protein [Xanthomonadaceae bacterium]
MSAIAALVVALACFAGLTAWKGEFERLDGILLAAFPLAVLPAMAAAGIAAWLVSLSNRFDRVSVLSCSIRVCLTAYPIFFLLVWGAIWTWLQFNQYLPPLERPGSVFRMAGTAMDYTMLAFVIGVLPAIGIEYFVIRFVRKRRSPALSTGVVS